MMAIERFRESEPDRPSSVAVRELD